MQNEEQALSGYNEALKQLEAEEKIRQLKRLHNNHKKIHITMPRPQNQNNQLIKEYASNTLHINFRCPSPTNEHRFPKHRRFS